MLFDVQVLQRQGWSIVSVVGDVDLATMPALRQGATGVDGPRVALDLSGVDHVDPIAFGIVVSIQLRTERQGGTFAVVCPPGRPRDLLAESRLDRIVRVVGALDELGDLGER